MTRYTYVKTDTGEVHIYIDGQHQGRALNEKAAREICTAGNKAKRKGMGLFTALLVMVMAGGFTIMALRAPSLPSDTIEALDNYRQLDAKIIKACRAEGLDKRACDAYRAEVRKAVVR